jgi:hypothetical protein
MFYSHKEENINIIVTNSPLLPLRQQVKRIDGSVTDIVRTKQTAPVTRNTETNFTIYSFICLLCVSFAVAARGSA